MAAPDKEKHSTNDNECKNCSLLEKKIIRLKDELKKLRLKLFRIRAQFKK